MNMNMYMYRLYVSGIKAFMSALVACTCTSLHIHVHVHTREQLLWVGCALAISANSCTFDLIALCKGGFHIRHNHNYVCVVPYRTHVN